MENSPDYYRSLSAEELEATVKELLEGSRGLVLRTTAAMRGKLLPALVVLRQRLNKRGRWQKFLRSVGITPAQWRQWNSRERFAAREVAHFLGEPAQRRLPAKCPAITQSEAEILARAGARLAKAVVGRDRKYALKLARAYLQASQDAGLAVTASRFRYVMVRGVTAELFAPTYAGGKCLSISHTVAPEMGAFNGSRT